MTQPSTRKLIDKPIIIALVAVALLGVATIVVVISNSRSSSSSAASSSPGPQLDTALESKSTASDSNQSSDGGDSGNTTTLSSTTAKVSYSYRNDAVSTSNGGGWIGPQTGTFGGYTIDHAMSLPTCSKSTGGLDFFIGATVSTLTDVKAAATDVVNKVGPAEFDKNAPVMAKSITTTDENLANGTQGVFAEVTFTIDDKDACGTKSYHVGALATDKNGKMGVLVVSYRLDGDGVDGKTYENLAVEILKTLVNV
ncbi:MAG: hypothetical protein ABI137_12460 [Antricoccus sp.]